MRAEGASEAQRGFHKRNPVQCPPGVERKVPSGTGRWSHDHAIRQRSVLLCTLRFNPSHLFQRNSSKVPPPWTPYGAYNNVRGGEGF